MCFHQDVLPSRSATIKMCFHRDVLPSRYATIKMCYQDVLPSKHATMKMCYHQDVLPTRCATTKMCYHEDVLPRRCATIKMCYHEDALLEAVQDAAAKEAASVDRGVACAQIWRHCKLFQASRSPLLRLEHSVGGRTTLFLTLKKLAAVWSFIVLKPHAEYNLFSWCLNC